MIVALGSTRNAKIKALRDSIKQIAIIDTSWEKAEIIAKDVVIDIPAMPMTDKELMLGAKARAEAIAKLFNEQGQTANFYVGLEGGFHSMHLDNKSHTFLRGWAYVTDTKQSSYGASPSIIVPDRIVEQVVTQKRELGEIIDQIAGQVDVRSNQGTWGVLSLDLFTRSMSFEVALIAAFAPFYNKKLFAET